MHRTTIFINLLALGAVLCAGCEPGEAPPATPPEQAEGTRWMAERLEAIASEAEADPRRNPYVNAARVRRLRATPPPARPQDLAQYKLMLGRELLRAGQNEAAIAQLSQVLQLAEEHPGAPPAFVLAVKDLLAISYLRLGEEENCILNHNTARCLLPVRAEGVHEAERGSRGAVGFYTQILEEAPDDLNARWLLNVAYMTLGEHPEGVPARWRIPAEAFASGYDIGRFRDVAPALGLDVVGLSGGAIMEDLSGDGHLDLMASSWGLRDQLRYFQNDGDGTFTERTEAAGLTGLVGGLNLVHADYNNDGHTDVLVLRGAWLSEGHPNSLLRNNGDGTFTDVTEEAGLLTERPTQTAAWGDFDNDGWLDLFVGNESHRAAGRNPAALYRNNQDGTFTNVAPELGLDVTRYIKAVLWGDYDNDGWQDLYISNWDAPNLLFRNEGAGAEMAFTEVGAEAGVREPVESFPAWFWDYDNDGWLDLFVSGWRASAGDMAAEYLGLPRKDEPPRLYRNRGDGTFADVTEAAGLDKVMFSMGSNYGDLDNDGWLDFYVGTGDPDFRSLMPNRAFRNAGGRYFQDVTTSGGVGHLQKGHGVAFGDLDHDGDQDMYAVMGGAFEGDVFGNALFENPGHGHRWVTLRLEGTASNRSAIGARIRVVVETEADTTRSIYRTVSTGGSFGASSLQQEIGLGEAEAIRAVEVTWPATGKTQRFEGLATDRVYRLREGDAAAVPLAPKPFRLAPPAAARAHAPH